MVISPQLWHQTLTILSLKNAREFWKPLHLPQPHSQKQVIVLSRKLVKKYRQLENEAISDSDLIRTNLERWKTEAEAQFHECNEEAFLTLLVDWMKFHYGSEYLHDLHFFVWRQIFSRLSETGGMNYPLADCPESNWREKGLFDILKELLIEEKKINEAIVLAEQNPIDEWDKILTQNQGLWGLPGIFDTVHDLIMKHTIITIWDFIDSTFSAEEASKVKEWANKQISIMGLQ